MEKCVMHVSKSWCEWSLIIRLKIYKYFTSNKDGMMHLPKMMTTLTYAGHTMYTSSVYSHGINTLSPTWSPNASRNYTSLPHSCLLKVYKRPSSYISTYSSQNPITNMHSMHTKLHNVALHHGRCR